ncbi:MAG: cation:proton antiporter [Candidatus Nanohalobium sp.]
MSAALSSQTLLTIGILLASSFIVGEIFERIGLESIIGYVVTGILFGPGLSKAAEIFNFIPQNFALSPEPVAGFATVGATLILFQAGLQEENVVEIFTHKEGLKLGVSALLGTFLFVFGALYFLSPEFVPAHGAQAFVFLALAYAVVDIGVPSKIMLSRDMLHGDFGSYTIKSSVINVTSGFIALTLLVVMASNSLEAQIMKIAAIIGFALAFYILHEFIQEIDDYVMMFEEAEAQFTITFALLLFMAYITRTIGLSSVLGAFFAGVLVSRSDFTNSRAFQDKIQGIGEGLFIPIFFAWFGLGLTIFGSHGMLAYLPAAVFLFTLSTAGKLAIGYFLAERHGSDSALAVASSLVALDIESLVVLLIGINLGVLEHSILQVFAPAVLFSAPTILFLYSLAER